jgi:hypothetical protein
MTSIWFGAQPCRSHPRERREADGFPSGTVKFELVINLKTASVRPSAPDAPPGRPGDQ